MIKSFRILFFLLYSSTHLLLAQAPTDLWVLDTHGKGGKLSLDLTTAKPLTNRKFYDNQPSFINDSELVFSAADEKGNHDIILYSFRTGNFSNLTQTPDRSEYSPAITDCRQYISAVVVEPDGTQRLWLYPIVEEPAELLYDDIAPVGYYDWVDNKGALFVLGNPNKLVYAKGKGDLLEIATQVGRSIKKRPKKWEITYISTEESSRDKEKNTYRIFGYDLKKNKSKQYGLTVPESQDLIWIDKNHLLMAHGNEFFIKEKNSNEWKSLGQVSSDTHSTVSRLAYSPDLNKLIFVMNRNQTQ
ncbi:hypothetical protein [Algoriphagus confluentis]|uniref:WD40-like Beta Propeller Repeat n=1 Tax=Algoriphagus confluentis TaxID=1697556 RepID=A0ABQ6PN61_9BACT|nr:hypothetical protein Aconfl_12410 [Algoriphagus confluentis]